MCTDLCINRCNNELPVHALVFINKTMDKIVVEELLTDY